MSSLEELAFSEAVRAISQQQAALEAVRTRVVAVVSAAAVATSLLNQGAFTRRHVDGWAVAALVCLATIGVLAVFVMYPRPWTFSNDVRDLVLESAEAHADDRDDELRKYLRDWAFHMAGHWEHHNQEMRLMTRAYGMATVLLVVLTILWVGRILG